MVFALNKAGLVIKQTSNEEVFVENQSKLVMPIVFMVVEDAMLGLAGTLKQLLLKGT